jgi:polyisoprenoid-binding protein YceI
MRAIATATAHEVQPPVRTSRPRPELWHAGPRESEIRLSLRHHVVARLAGRVGRWRASFVIDLDQPSRSSIEVIVDAASIETGAPERDSYARSAEFLNVSRFPEIRFQSRDIHARGDRRLTIIGDLTIRDVTREVQVEVERTPAVAVRSQVSKLVFKGHVSVPRQDFGLRWHDEPDRAAGLLAADHIDIEFKVNARRGAK